MRSWEADRGAGCALNADEATSSPPPPGFLLAGVDAACAPESVLVPLEAASSAASAG